MTAGGWRVGGHVPHHVYEQIGVEPSTAAWPRGDRPVATFLDPADARRAVVAVGGLPHAEPDEWDSQGPDAPRVPVWRFDSGVRLEGDDSVEAWSDGLVADGDLSSGAAVDAIEQDAYRLLAAVAWYRRLARGDS